MDLDTSIWDYQYTWEVFEIFLWQLHLLLNCLRNDHRKVINALVEIVRLWNIERTILDWVSDYILIVFVEVDCIMPNKNWAFLCILKPHFWVIHITILFRVDSFKHLVWYFPIKNSLARYSSCTLILDSPENSRIVILNFLVKSADRISLIPHFVTADWARFYIFGALRIYEQVFFLSQIRRYRVYDLRIFLIENLLFLVRNIENRR